MQLSSVPSHENEKRNEIGNKNMKITTKSMVWKFQKWKISIFCGNFFRYFDHLSKWQYWLKYCRFLIDNSWDTLKSFYGVHLWNATWISEWKNGGRSIYSTKPLKCSPWPLGLLTTNGFFLANMSLIPWAT